MYIKTDARNKMEKKRMEKKREKKKKIEKKQQSRKVTLYTTYLTPIGFLGK